MKRPTSLKGFTLIELLIVVVIIGILAAGAVALFGGAQGSARDGVRKSDMSTLKTAFTQLQIARTDQAVPNNNDAANHPLANMYLNNDYAAGIKCTAVDTACEWGLVKQYVQKKVVPPRNGELYYYGSCKSGATTCTPSKDYFVAAWMEAEGKPYMLNSGTDTIDTSAWTLAMFYGTADPATAPTSADYNVFRINAYVAP